jgi:hypothetical protein
MIYLFKYYLTRLPDAHFYDAILHSDKIKRKNVSIYH